MCTLFNSSKRIYPSVRLFSSLAKLRSHNCGSLTLKNEGEKVCLMGWLAFKRMDKFIVLRDRNGYVQARYNPTSEFARIVENLSYESVLQVEGVVKSRGKDVNKKMATGEIEVEVSDLKVLNRCDSQLPLLPNSHASERLRMKYRYLDIRSDRVQRNLRQRAEITQKMSRFLENSYGFEAVETPTLFRRTPGGAAEFLVPCSSNIGQCYSLPQSPQQHKQLLMMGGWDRYYQVARCYRDEGSKGDRQPEFTQVDIEMSFTNKDEVLQVIEGMITAGWPDSLKDLKPIAPFPRLTYKEAMKLYGIDKPDMRIPWIIEDASEILAPLKSSTSSPTWVARLIVCKEQASTVSGSRKKEWKRLIGMNSNGQKFDVYAPQKKQWFNFLENSEIIKKFNVEEGDAVIFAWGEEEGITGQHYDLVINGVEMGGGSIRIHNAGVQRLVLDILEENSNEMDYLIKALSYGAPPHGGFALGLDRFVALMVGEGDPSVPVRDVIAFPKTKEGRDLMCDAPAVPSEDLLQRYGFRVPPTAEMSRNIRTLGDFNNDHSHSGDSGEDSDNGQEFYVGGSEQSGQQVLGPGGRRDPRDAIFQAARRAGARAVHEEEHINGAQVGGGGMRLGRPGESSSNTASASRNPSAQNQPDVVTVRMDMWENGFSLNDGPLREFTDPANQDFMREVLQRRIPAELTATYPRHTIDIQFERKTGPYVIPKAKPFEGVGERLGGVVPNVVTNDVPVAPQPTPQEAEDTLAKAQAEVKLDIGSPSTQLQIRLHDGKRLVCKFNHTHTISAIRNFIVNARPEMAFFEFQLMTTYPNKILDDENLSLADAGLLNAVIAVKPVV